MRVVANLGRVDTMKEGRLDTLIRGLSRVAGCPEPDKLEVAYENALGFGDVFALHELWKNQGFDRALGRSLRSGRRQIDVDALVRAMVFNSLCDPASKLGCLRWLHTVHPGNVAETKTLRVMLATVLQRFPIDRVILVADRGLPSLDNIGALTSLAEQGGRTPEFILAVPARRYSDLVEPFRDMAFDDNGLAESRFAGHRLIVAHDRVHAAEQGERRRARIADHPGMGKPGSEQALRSLCQLYPGRDFAHVQGDRASALAGG